MKLLYELNDYYGYNWNSDVIYKAISKIEKLKERTDKYLLRFKTKELICENGCLNYKALNTELTENYELIIYWNLNGYSIYTKITLEDVINKNYYFEYDRKYHILKANTY